MQAAASTGLLLMSMNMQPALAQQTNPTAPATPQTVVNDTTGQPGLPQAPQPRLTEPLYLRSTGRDYSKPKSHFWNPIAPYTPTDVPLPRLGNTPNLDGLLRDGKIYLSLSDAVMLALENNYDIAISRINLDIADTDILRAKGILDVKGEDKRLVFQAVHMILEGDFQRAWTDKDKRYSRMVFIGRDLDEAELRRGFEATAA